MKKFASILLVGMTIFPASAAYADRQDCDRSGDCGGQEYDQNYGSRDDRNRNRDRDRGAFSPGPFDDSPVDAFNNVCMPGATCEYHGDPKEGDKESSPKE